jgi:hypothetical protein
MKLTSLSTLAMLLSAGYAMAGGGAPVPAIPESSPPSGRPSQVISDEAQCEAIWNKTDRVDDALGSDKAAPFITNFHMVDTNSDHKVSLEEFKAGCKNGWVEEGSGSRLPTKQISPDVPKE